MTKALLKRARPYQGRRLEQEEIDGSYSLKFSQCVEVKTANEDLFDENIIDYVKAGQVVSAKSYVLFHLCQGSYCYYDSDDDLYIVDLPTYLASIGPYHANKRLDYCEQCERFDDYCNAEEDEDEEAAEENEADEGEDEADEDEADEDEADEGEDEADEDEGEEEQDEEGDENQEEQEEDEENDGAEEGGEDAEGEGEGEDRRRLTKSKYSKKIERKLANKDYIDCNQCETYDCFVDEEDLDDSVQSQEEIDNYISEWIEELAGCQETGVQWNGMDVYTSVMCSPYGDGVELAVFVDEECTMYTNQLAFTDVYNPDGNQDDNQADNGSNIDYFTYVEGYIKTAFSEVTSCGKQEFDDPEEEENDDEAEDEEVDYEMNDYCQGVLDGDLVDFNNCGADEGDAQEGEEQENDYEWYSYDMAEADDLNQVCAVVNQMEGEFSYVYDEEGSGTWYERSRSGTILTGDEQNPLIERLTTLSPAIIAGIVAGIVVLLSMLCCCCRYCRARPKKTNSYVPEEPTAYQGGQMS